jgi:hypothetical protein
MIEKSCPFFIINYFNNVIPGLIRGSGPSLSKLLLSRSFDQVSDNALIEQWRIW